MFVLCTKKELEKTKNFLYSRFGINKNYLNNFLCYKYKKSLFLITNDKKEIIQKLIFKKNIRSLGIEIFCDLRQLIPSSLGFGGVLKIEQIKSNFLILNREQAISFFENENIDAKKIESKNLLSSGYVIGIYNKKIIGTLYYDKLKEMCTPNLSFENKNIK
jgi:hypothetical protein